MSLFHIDGQKPYTIQQIEKLHTPRLLVFEDRIRRNIARMKAYLEEVAPASGFRHLCTHVKTHKSTAITQMMMEAGISSFKTSLNEVELVGASGVVDAFVAYPLIRQDAFRMANWIRRFPQTRYSVQIGSLTHAEILREVAEKERVKWHYFIDIDVGMHRTGIPAEDVFHLYDQIFGWKGFTFLGLHGYDGHNHFEDANKRMNEAKRAMDLLLKAVAEFKHNGVSIPRLVVAGSPSFRVDFGLLQGTVGSDTLVQVSPGTWIYWDSGYDRLLPGEFELAALILAQVIELGDGHRMTLNLGHKRWGADQGPVQTFSHPGLTVYSFNEEHTVLKTDSENQFKIGDYLLIVPRHVCSTVNLYETFSLIGDNGEIKNSTCPVNARNR